MKDVKALGEQLVGLTVTEVRELATYLKETYNIEPATVGVVALPGDKAVAPVEKTNYDLFLKETGANKLQIVKLVKDVLGLGLKEAKELVDKAPTTLKEGLPKSEAQNILNQLQNAGAVAELK